MSASASATVGAYPWTGLQSFELWDGSTAEVNLATGNLLVSVTDFQANAPGIAPRMTRYYNSLSARTGALGNWTLGVGPDVGVDYEDVYGDTLNTFYGPNGHEVEYMVDASPGADVSPAGMNTTPQIGGQGSLSALVFNQSGNRMSFTYDYPAQGWLLNELGRNGIGTTYTYLANGGFEMTDAVGRVNTFTRQSHSAARFTAADGRYWTYSFTNGRLTYAANAYHDGGGMLSYDAQGRLTFMAGGNSFVELDGSEVVFERSAAFTYDSSGRVATVTQGTGGSLATFAPSATSSFTYGSGTATVENAVGNDTTYALDASGRITATTNPLGNTNATTWNAQNAVTSTSNAGAGTGSQNLATTAYDSLGNATSYTLPTGAAARAVYQQGVDCPNASPGSPYLPDCNISAAGVRTEHTYDAAGNRTSSVTGGVTISSAYETNGSVCGGVAGQVCSTTDGNGHSTTYAYGTYANLVSVTPPAPLSPTTYQWDASSRLTSTTSGGVTTTYSYDMWDNVRVERIGSPAHQIYREVDDSGLVHAVYWSGGQSSTRSEEYTFNALGLELTRTTSVNNAVVTESSATYDAIGNMTTYSSGYGTVTAQYDAANQLVALAEPGSTCPSGQAAASAGCVRFQYDADGNETRRLFPGGGTQVNTYDAANRLTSVSAIRGTTRSYALQYSYATATGADSTLLRRQIENPLPQSGTSSTAQRTTTYAYDVHDRLTGATETSTTNSTQSGTQTASWAYAYDNNDNVTSQTRQGQNLGGVPAGTRAFTYNAANQITGSSADTTAWAYDSVGQMTRNGITGVQSTYGSREQVTAVGSTTYTSYGQGNTLTTADSTGDAFTVTALGVATRTAASVTTNYLRTTEGELVGFDTGPTSNYYITDVRGSVIGIYGDTGTWRGVYTYSPTGETRTATTNSVITANQYRYIGGEREGSLYRFGARYYDPSLGVFTQMDPTGQELNPYSYAGCNPINNADPTGTDIACTLAEGTVVAVGLALATLGVITAFFPPALPGTGTLAAVAALIGAVAAGFIFLYGC